MKIVIIGPAYPLRGGIAKTNEELCKSLNRLGHRTEIISFKLQYPSLLFPGKSQYSNNQKPDIIIESSINSINPFNWIIVGKKINNKNPDLVIFRYWLPFMSPCLGSIARFLNKSIKIIAITDNIIPHEKRLGDNLLTKYFINACSGFIAMSTSVQKELTTISQKPISYCPHPIMANFGEKIQKKIACEALNLNANFNYLLFFGLIRKYKGLDLLIKALAKSQLKELNIKLIIAGEFYENPKTYLSLISDLGIKNNVIIHNHFIDDNDVKYYFSACDIVAQTYHTATQSGVTQIAYNFDCPMLVTNVGGLGELIPNNKVGYVVERDPVHIANAILEFYTNDRKKEFSKNVATEKEKYSWNTFSKNLIEFVETKI